MFRDIEFTVESTLTIGTGLIGCGRSAFQIPATMAFAQLYEFDTLVATQGVVSCYIAKAGHFSQHCQMHFWWAYTGCFLGIPEMKPLLSLSLRVKHPDGKVLRVGLLELP